MNMKETIKVEPFLKWAGGKRWLIASHKDLFDVEFKRYIEPFVGSGSVFFYLDPPKAILSDINRDLMEVYRSINTDWKELEIKLASHSKSHSNDYYYKVRSASYGDPVARAAQFIYLNRTCWNGLYRVNRQGKFNVPKGTKGNVLLDSDNFEMVSNRLKKAQLFDGDFEAIVKKAQSGDLLFVDPPYTANHNNNGFLKYNETIFSWEDQVRLSNCVKKAKSRGVQVILTNADHPSVRELYEGSFNLRSVERASRLSGKPEFRGKVTELLVTS